MKEYKVFAINPGSTSTKIAMFVGDNEVFSKNVSHDAEELKKFAEINDQMPYRKKMILDAVAEEGQTLEGVDAFVRRSGVALFTDILDYLCDKAHAARAAAHITGRGFTGASPSGFSGGVPPCP